MQTKLFLLSLTLLLIFTGCEKIEEDELQGTAEVENESYEANQNNTCYSNFENTAGCFGSDQRFGDELISEGFWSVYSQSDNYILYYDTYQYGYQFDDDGSVKMRRERQNYTYSSLSMWGVNTDGSKLTIHPDESFTISSKIIGSACYKVTVTSSSETLKICNESALSGESQNSSGYYGETLKFGNYVYGDFNVVGDWEIDGITFSLEANGTTSNGGEWGLSSDAKLITIDNIVYLVYKYPDNSCIETFIMEGDDKTERKTLCKL